MSNTMQDLTDMQRLACAQALYNRLGEYVGKKAGLRRDVDEQVLGFYEATGAKSYDVNIHGMKVGTMSVTVSKEVEHTVFDKVDADAFASWLDTDEGLDAVVEYLRAHEEDFVRAYVADTGEIPPGVSVRTVTEPSRVKGTVLRVQPDKVASAMRGELPTVVAGLIEGGAR